MRNVLPACVPTSFVTLGQLSPPTPEGLYAWLASAVCVLGIYYLLLKIVKEHRRSPSIDVEITGFARKSDVDAIHLRLPEFATRPELEAVAKQLGNQLAESVKHLDHKRSVSIGTLHTALTETKQQVSALVATGEIRTQQVHHIENQIDRILERLPRKA